MRQNRMPIILYAKKTLLRQTKIRALKHSLLSPQRVVFMSLFRAKCNQISAENDMRSARCQNPFPPKPVTSLKKQRNESDKI